MSRLTLLADGDTVTNNDSVIVRFTASDETVVPMDLVVHIIPNTLQVDITPNILYPGDTANVVIKRRLPDGTLEDFDSTQTFEVAKLEGCLEGDILVGNEKGAYFYDVNQPIYFVIADSLDGDSSGTVLLRVGLIDNNKSGYKHNPNDIYESECFTGNYISPIWIDKSFSVGPKIELLSYANGQSENWINGDNPAMPVFPIELKITNDSRGGLLTYYLFVKWTNTQQTGSPTYSGVAKDFVMINPEQLPIIDFNVVWHYLGEDVIVGGDELTLRVIYNGVIKNFNLSNTDILGKNPVDKTPVVNYLDTKLQEPKLKQMKVIIFKESSWRQFETNGYCNINFSQDPPDWGMCQINKGTPTLGEIWNWEENVNSGIAHLDFCYADTEDFYRRIKEKHPDAVYFTNQELLMMTSQRYRKGRYYADWMPYDNKTKEPGHWRENIHPRFTNYGKDFWDKYEHNIY